MSLRVHRLAPAAVSAVALALGGLAATAPTAQAQTAQPKVKHLCSAPAPHSHQMACLALARTDVTEPHALTAHAVSPLATPSGYGPSDLLSAYNLPSNGGAGQTVAIVDAYDDPNAESDLATYRSQYGLPSCTTANGCFSKIDENGGTSYPTADSGWAGEISLDLDMVSAVAPDAHILLVEASSANMSDLGQAVNEAVAKGARYVSNSYGGSEDSSDTSADSSYFDHPGVAITVSAGDSAYGVEYPAASPYVTSVGGTSLSRDSSTSRGWTESVWSTSSTEGTGSGCSAYETKPSWQTDSGCAKRTVADVSAVADPATGVAVYDSYQSSSAWNVYGGTSASSPIIAAVYADAGTPGSGDIPAKYPYRHTSALNDVTSGSNGSCSPAYLCTAQAGYDGPTGLGTPNGLTAFKAGSSSGNTVTVTNPGNQSGTVGTAASLQIKASDSAAGQTLTYSATGLPAGLSVNSSTGLISGTPTTAGTYSVTVSAKDTTGAAGSASFTWTVSGSGGGGCSSAQLIRNPGFETGSASPWSASSGVINSDTASEPAHSGSYDAWLDGYGTTHTDTLSQSVTVPAGCSSATFSFWLHVDTAETTTSTAYDTLKVQVTGASGTTTTLHTYSNLDAASGYAQHSFNLASYAGQTVTVKFTGTEDTSLQTSFVVDDTALNVG